MPFELRLPDALRKQGWRVKIRERERLEPPHVSIIRRLRTWRFGLRDSRFLDRSPTTRDVPQEIVDHICAHLDELRQEWDAMYPENPIGEEE